MADQPAGGFLSGWVGKHSNGRCFRRNDITTKVRFHHDDMVMFSFQHLFTIGSSLVHHVSSLPLHVPSLPHHVPSLPYYVSSLSYHAISLIHHCLIMSCFSSSRSESGSDSPVLASASQALHAKAPFFSRSKTPVFLYSRISVD